MSRILFTWECGAGLGHLTRYSTLIDRLIAAGHDISFAARSLSSAHRVYGDRNVSLLQSPIRMEPLEGGISQPRSYLDVLKNQGFAMPNSLRGRHEAWVTLFELVKPALIICDHSPTAVVAAQHYSHAKLVMSGNGFTVPPITYPFRAFPLDSEITEVALLGAEQAFLDQHLNPLLQAQGKSAFIRLCDAFKTDARWVFSFSEFDHYPQRELDAHLGTGFSPQGESPVWPEGTGARIFAYLKPQQDLVMLLDAISQSGNTALIKVDHLPQEIQQRYSSDRIRFVDHLQDLNQVAQQCDLGITNGSPSATASFLLAGKPVLMIPQHIEQLLGSLAIESNGCGISINRLKRHHHSFVSALDELTRANNPFRRAALRFAQQYGDYDTTSPDIQMMKDVDRLLDLSPATT